jgi:hypothetical protein
MENRLPNASSLVIDPRKLREYVLNFEHPTGKYKAAFFAQMDYIAIHWQELEKDIREQHLVLPAEAGQNSPFGLKYTITGPLAGPSGDIRTLATHQIRRISSKDVITTRQAALAV